MPERDKVAAFRGDERARPSAALAAANSGKQHGQQQPQSERQQNNTIQKAKAAPHSAKIACVCPLAKRNLLGAEETIRQASCCIVRFPDVRGIGFCFSRTKRL